MKTLQVFILACLLLKNVEAVPLASFYSFGSSAGDTSLPRNDDGYSSLISLSTAFPYFGTNHMSGDYKLKMAVAKPRDIGLSCP